MQAKAAQITVGACLLLGAVLCMVSSLDEVTCVSGGLTSEGVPCGVHLSTAAAIFAFSAPAALIGIAVTFRGLRRPVEPSGDTGWRGGQAIMIIASGLVLGLMIPRYVCPGGMRLSPLFHFCLSADRVFPSPSPGLPWKFAASASGIALGVLVIKWRTMPWQLASAIVAAAFSIAVLYTLQRTVGLPW